MMMSIQETYRENSTHRGIHEVFMSGDQLNLRMTGNKEYYYIKDNI